MTPEEQKLSNRFHYTRHHCGASIASIRLAFRFKLGSAQRCPIIVDLEKVGSLSFASPVKLTSHWRVLESRESCQSRNRTKL